MRSQGKCGKLSKLYRRIFGLLEGKLVGKRSLGPDYEWPVLEFKDQNVGRVLQTYLF